MPIVNRRRGQVGGYSAIPGQNVYHLPMDLPSQPPGMSMRGGMAGMTNPAALNTVAPLVDVLRRKGQGYSSPKMPVMKRLDQLAKMVKTGKQPGGMRLWENKGG